MDPLSAIILGLIQGITEFLPVSSTGHLALLHAVLGEVDVDSLAFDAVLHLATALAIIVYYFDEIYILTQTVMRKFGRLPVNEKDLTLAKALAVGTIPAVIAGLLLETYIETIFRNPLLIAAVLVVGSIFFIVAEYRYENSFHNNDIDVPTGFKVGLFQCLALIPGFSRSGATIAGGMLLGMSRSDSARFAFLLAVPVILGAGFKKLLDLISEGEVVNWVSVGAGAVTAFTVGILAIHLMLSFVRKYSLWPFIWYRIILAGFVVFVTFYG